MRMKISAVVVLALLSVFGSAGSATAQRTSALQNEMTRWCLDDSPVGLRMFPCNGQIYQRWSAANANSAFRNSYTNECLDDPNRPDGRLITLPCNQSNYQAWRPINFGAYRNMLRNVATGRCLDDSGQFGLRSFACNFAPNPYQLWLTGP